MVKHCFSLLLAPHRTEELAVLGKLGSIGLVLVTFSPLIYYISLMGTLSFVTTCTVATGILCVLFAQDKWIKRSKWDAFFMRPWDDNKTCALRPIFPRQQALKDARHPCIQTT